jgi:tetratricopeptide (TPR) repeat protein
MTGNSDPQVIAGIKHARDLYSEGETEAAVQYLLALIDNFPATASLHGYVALLFSRVGQLDEAIDHGRQAVYLSPTSENASLVLFEALSKSGLHIEALEEMKRFLALKPSREYLKTIEEWELNESKICPCASPKFHPGSKRPSS